MKKWEYKIVCVNSLKFGTLDRLLKRLDELGDEGWELVSTTESSSFDTYTSFLKREKEE